MSQAHPENSPALLQSQIPNPQHLPKLGSLLCMVSLSPLLLSTQQMLQLGVPGTTHQSNQTGERGKHEEGTQPAGGMQRRVKSTHPFVLHLQQGLLCLANKSDCIP